MINFKETRGLAGPGLRLIGHGGGDNQPPGEPHVRDVGANHDQDKTTTALRENTGRGGQVRGAEQVGTGLCDSVRWFGGATTTLITSPTCILWHLVEVRTK
ncbi:hypothetical protein FOCC_FOCC007342 [Frankliniella occidentalis]|nr:hypothetical protein FOCC_FOCC007342 [Frankliniella occidentalis]